MLKASCMQAKVREAADFQKFPKWRNSGERNLVILEVGVT